MPPFNFIEVCAGAGGLSTGLIKAGFQPVLLNDLDRDCCKTLQLNHPENTQIEQSSMDKLDLNQYRDQIDLLTGGVPCQSFSQAGLRKGLDDSRGELIIKFMNLIRDVRPKMFLIENVKGLLSHEKGATLKKIINKIHFKTNHNYEINYQVLNSSEYAVPQKRERIFIIGNLKHLSFDFPEKADHKLVLKDVLEDVPDSEGASYPQEKVKLFEQIPQAGCWVNLPEDLQKSYLGKSYYSGGGKRGILHRLSMEKPCLTLLCTPSQKQTERCHPLETRPLTVREYARIQTFPDDYVFSGSMSSKYKQIGNAVPVELARRVGLALIECLENE